MSRLSHNGPVDDAAWDVVLRGGRVTDPESGPDAIADVAMLAALSADLADGAPGTGILLSYARRAAKSDHEQPSSAPSPAEPRSAAALADAVLTSTSSFRQNCFLAAGRLVALSYLCSNNQRGCDRRGEPAGRAACPAAPWEAVPTAEPADMAPAGRSARRRGPHPSGCRASTRRPADLARCGHRS